MVAPAAPMATFRKTSMIVLPPDPPLCPECAVTHRADEPHCRESVYYQAKFSIANGRLPTWTDAMANCPAEVKAEWRASLINVLIAGGDDVPDDLR